MSLDGGGGSTIKYDDCHNVAKAKRSIVVDRNSYRVLIIP